MSKKVTFGARPKQPPTSDPAKADEWVKSQPTGETEKMKRLTIDIPANLHARIKSQCALKGINMNEAVRTLLEKHFSANK